MNNQEIIDNAPQGATHIDSDFTYIKTEPNGRFRIYFTFQNGEWVEDDEFNILLTRSLADIKRIVELEKSGNEMAIIIADLRAHLKEQE